MILGIDFDNTIVCYDAVFYQVARSRNLIPADLPNSKTMVRDYLRRAGKEKDWTRMQGYVYGSRMREAEPYPGVLDFFLTCKNKKIETYIISHKTLFPYEGEQYNLHASAQSWLEQFGFFDTNRIGLNKNNAAFVLTKEKKLEQIAAVGCTHFIDDLPEFLLEAKFPPNVARILFDPNQLYPDYPGIRRSSSWQDIRKACFG